MEEQKTNIVDNNFKDTNKFKQYLLSSKDNILTLDLTNCTVIECINKMCEIKERSYPKIK